MKEKNRVRGMVTVTVCGADGNIKRQNTGVLRRLLHIPGKKMVYRHHNTITVWGEALIANWMLAEPTEPKITETTGYILVGTGWKGDFPKVNKSCNKATGTYQKLTAGYPKTQDPFGGNGQGIVLYEATFPVGSLNAAGINEAALLNGNNETASCLAYAQVLPAVDVTSADSLTIDWEIMITGS
jgi:hypothetical protein